MGFNSAFKGLKLLKKTPGNWSLNNLNDPILNVLMGKENVVAVLYCAGGKVTSVFDLWRIKCGAKKA